MASELEVGSLNVGSGKFVTDSSGNVTQKGDVLKVERTDNAPSLDLYNNKSAPTANTALGYYSFKGKAPSGAYSSFANIGGFVESVSSGNNVSGYLTFNTTDGSTATVERMRISSTGKVAIGGITAPDGTLHVHTASAGTVTADADRDDLVIENDTNVGMTFLSPPTDKAEIAFGDSGNSRQGLLTYDHDDDSLAFKVNNVANTLKIASTGLATFGTVAGITIDGANEVGKIGTTNFFNLAADTSGTGAGGGTETFSAPSSIFAIYIGDGQGALFFSEYQSATVTKLAGSTVFAAGSSSGDIRVFKSEGSNATVTVRNYRTGSSANLKVMALGV